MTGISSLKYAKLIDDDHMIIAYRSPSNFHKFRIMKPIGSAQPPDSFGQHVDLMTNFSPSSIIFDVDNEILTNGNTMVVIGNSKLTLAEVDLKSTPVNIINEVDWSEPNLIVINALKFMKNPKDPQKYYIIATMFIDGEYQLKVFQNQISIP